MHFEVLQKAGFPHTNVIYYSRKTKQDFTTYIKWLTEKTPQTQTEKTNR